MGDCFSLFLEPLLAIVLKSFTFGELRQQVLIFRYPTFYPLVLKQIGRRGSWNVLCVERWTQASADTPRLNTFVRPSVQKANFTVVM